MAVELSTREDCAVLVLNRPEALNALSFEIIRRIGAVFDEVAQSKARALIVTGAGPKAFCAGADIKELRNRDLWPRSAALSSVRQCSPNSTPCRCRRSP